MPAGGAAGAGSDALTRELACLRCHSLSVDCHCSIHVHDRFPPFHPKQVTGLVRSEVYDDPLLQPEPTLY